MNVKKNIYNAAVCLLSLSLFVFSGCQSARKKAVEQQLLTSESEEKLAGELRAAVGHKTGFYNDKETSKFLEKILRKIVESNSEFHSSEKYSIHLLNTRDRIFIGGLNGDLFLSLGAIQSANFENELAYMLSFALTSVQKELARKKILSNEGEAFGNGLIGLPTNPPQSHQVFGDNLFKKNGFFDFGVETYVALAKDAVRFVHNAKYDSRGAVPAVSGSRLFFSEYLAGGESLISDVRSEVARLSPTRDVILKTREFDIFVRHFRQRVVRAKKKP